jgi:hypothetical protein
MVESEYFNDTDKENVMNAVCDHLLETLDEKFTTSDIAASGIEKKFKVFELYSTTDILFNRRKRPL